MQSLSSLESSSTRDTLGTTWLIHREEKTLCLLSEAEQSIIWASQEPFSRLFGSPKQVLFLPGSGLPFLSFLLPRHGHTGALPVPQLSPHQQGRGAAAAAVSTPSLSPSPHAPAPAQRVGAAALTWLSHPRPGPRQGEDAVMDGGTA